MIIITSDVLEHKWRASLCTNETLQKNLSVALQKYKYVAIVTILYLTNTELLSYLNFPYTNKYPR